MYAYRDLHSLLELSVQWEKELKDLYDVAEHGVKKAKSKELVRYLQEKQSKILEVIKNIDVRDYGEDEFLRFTRDDHTEELIPNKKLKKDSEPHEIIDMIKEYESKLKGFYSDIKDHLVSENQKELFQSLVTLKDAQLEALENFIREQLKQVV